MHHPSWMHTETSARWITNECFMIRFFWKEYSQFNTNKLNQHWHNVDCHMTDVFTFYIRIERTELSLNLSQALKNPKRTWLIRSLTLIKAIVIVLLDFRNTTQKRELIVKKQWFNSPNSSSSDVMDLDRIESAVVGALLGGGGATTIQNMSVSKCKVKEFICKNQ